MAAGAGQGDGCPLALRGSGCWRSSLGKPSHLFLLHFSNKASKGQVRSWFLDLIPAGVTGSLVSVLQAEMCVIP